MSLEIIYIDAPEGAQTDMAVTGENGNAVADTVLVAAGAPDIPYATLEPGVWKLDGSRKLLPEEPVVGWWSRERSGEGGRFETPPGIILKFSLPYSSTGLTFTFSPSTGQWCREIYVAWFNGQTLLQEGVFYPDSGNWVLNQAVESFDQIHIELRATNHPGHFAKVQRIEIGRMMTFGKGELTNVRLVNEPNLASSGKPENRTGEGWGAEGGAVHRVQYPGIQKPVQDRLPVGHRPAGRYVSGRHL